MKRCFKCGTEKPFSDFYRHKMMADGYLGKCKECAKADVRQNRSARADHYREYDRGRGNLPHRVAARAVYAETPEGKGKLRAGSARWIERNPIKTSAHLLTRRAIRSGRLVRQPCEVCGAAEVHGHHDDYALPLVVRWLCPAHHSEWHKSNTPLFGGKPLED